MSRKTEQIGDFEMGADFIALVTERAMQSVLEELRPIIAAGTKASAVDVIKRLAEMVSRCTIVATLEELEEGGFCSLSFHRSPMDTIRSDGRCDFCERPESEHESIKVCPDECSNWKEATT